jgi:GDPmannose 4,6-dehydratase
LAAQTFVGSSWDFPAQTWECNTTGIIHILEAIRQHKSTCRFYNAGSSEEYGNVVYSPQDENHPAKPRSPYGASKSAARQLVKVYRESYNLYAVQGLLFNHEGTRRGEEFVTRKITKGVARIKKALLEGKSFEPIELGNVKAKRDWSDAEDFVDGIWKMLNQETPNEYVLSSNETHTIAEFVWYAFKGAEIEGAWHGQAESAEFSISTKDANKYEPVCSVLVKINPKFYRPAEVDLLLGDSTKARNELKWKPETSFEQLVEKMVKNDLKQIGL